MNKSSVKNLDYDNLIGVVYNLFSDLKDPRKRKFRIDLQDILMSALVMFLLKDESLLAFDRRNKENPNFKNLYNIKDVPSDTYMREILDKIDPEELREIFTKMLSLLDKYGYLNKFKFLDDYYLVSVDGTGFFSSNKINCENCLEKVNSKTGVKTYYHQMLGGAIVNPDMKTVIPLCPEPILKQDGSKKNDCELNSSKRFLKKLRQEQPNMKIVIVEDALSANAPHIKELVNNDFKFIIVAKDSNKFLYDIVDKEEQKGNVSIYEYKEGDVLYKFRFINNVPLNASNKDTLVNFLEYWEERPNTNKKTKEKNPILRKHSAWITNITLHNDNVYKIMRGGRSRRKIENETFNTLKNQGYNFEHNYGHGEKNLSTVLAILMIIAFFIDQIQQTINVLFIKYLDDKNSKISLWEAIRSFFRTYVFDSIKQVLEAIVHGFKQCAIIIDTS